jgi:peptidoglycan/xylan/chitin deacetylase (PgdA/CDA1 family)
MTAALLRLAVDAAGAARFPQRLLILTYHRVLAEPDALIPDEVHARTFREHIEFFAANFHVLRLAEAVQRLQAGTLPKRALAITFDDGYLDNLEVAAPILRSTGVPGTFFVATGYMDGSCMWNDVVFEAARRTTRSFVDLDAIGLGRHDTSSSQHRRQFAEAAIDALKYREAPERSRLTQALAEAAEVPMPRGLMMRADQVAELHRLGMEIGAHTVTHPILARLDAASAEREIAESRAQLRAITGAEVPGFAYPNGRPGRDYAPEHARMVERAGFRYAVSTAPGCANRQSSRHELPRSASWGRPGLRMAARLFRMYFEPES